MPSSTPLRNYPRFHHETPNPFSSSHRARQSTTQPQQSSLKPNPTQYRGHVSVPQSPAQRDFGTQEDAYFKSSTSLQTTPKDHSLPSPPSHSYSDFQSSNIPPPSAGWSFQFSSSTNQQTNPWEGRAYPDWHPPLLPPPPKVRRPFAVDLSSFSQPQYSKDPPVVDTAPTAGPSMPSSSNVQHQEDPHLRQSFPPRNSRQFPSPTSHRRYHYPYPLHPPLVPPPEYFDRPRTPRRDGQLHPPLVVPPDHDFDRSQHQTMHDPELDHDFEYPRVHDIGDSKGKGKDTDVNHRMEASSSGHPHLRRISPFSGDPRALGWGHQQHPQPHRDDDRHRFANANTDNSYLHQFRQFQDDEYPRRFPDPAQRRQHDFYPQEFPTDLGRESPPPPPPAPPPPPPAFPLRSLAVPLPTASRPFFYPRKDLSQDPKRRRGSTQSTKGREDFLSTLGDIRGEKSTRTRQGPEASESEKPDLGTGTSVPGGQGGRDRAFRCTGETRSRLQGDDRPPKEGKARESVPLQATATAPPSAPGFDYREAENQPERMAEKPPAQRRRPFEHVFLNDDPRRFEQQPSERIPFAERLRRDSERHRHTPHPLSNREPTNQDEGGVPMSRSAPTTDPSPIHRRRTTISHHPADSGYGEREYHPSPKGFEFAHQPPPPRVETPLRHASTVDDFKGGRQSPAFPQSQRGLNYNHTPGLGEDFGVHGHTPASSTNPHPPEPSHLHHSWKAGAWAQKPMDSPAYYSPNHPSPILSPHNCNFSHNLLSSRASTASKETIGLTDDRTTIEPSSEGPSQHLRHHHRSSSVPYNTPPFRHSARLDQDEDVGAYSHPPEKSKPFMGDAQQTASPEQFSVNFESSTPKDTLEETEGSPPANVEAQKLLKDLGYLLDEIELTGKQEKEGDETDGNTEHAGFSERRKSAPMPEFPKSPVVEPTVRRGLRSRSRATTVSTVEHGTNRIPAEIKPNQEDPSVYPTTQFGRPNQPGLSFRRSLEDLSSRRPTSFQPTEPLIDPKPDSLSGSSSSKAYIRSIFSKGSRPRQEKTQGQEQAEESSEDVEDRQGRTAAWVSSFGEKDRPSPQRSAPGSLRGGFPDFLRQKRNQYPNAGDIHRDVPLPWGIKQETPITLGNNHRFASRVRFDPNAAPFRSGLPSHRFVPSNEIEAKIRDLSERGIHAYEQARYFDALHFFNEALTETGMTEKARTTLMYNRANTLLRCGSPDDLAVALRDCKEVLRVRPDYYRTMRLLARIHFARREYIEAETGFWDSFYSAISREDQAFAKEVQEELRTFLRGQVKRETAAEEADKNWKRQEERLNQQEQVRGDAYPQNHYTPPFKTTPEEKNSHASPTTAPAPVAGDAAPMPTPNLERLVNQEVIDHLLALDYYKLLGVPKGSTTEEITSAYRKAFRKYHPDRNGTEYEDVCKRVSAAKDILTSPKRRNQYDRQLARVSQQLQLGQEPSPIIV